MDEIVVAIREFLRVGHGVKHGLCRLLEFLLHLRLRVVCSLLQRSNVGIVKSEPHSRYTALGNLINLQLPQRILAYSVGL